MNEGSLSIDLREVKHHQQFEPPQNILDDVDHKYSEENLHKQQQHDIFGTIFDFLKNLALPRLCLYGFIFYYVCYFHKNLSEVTSTQLNIYVLAITSCLLVLSFKDLPKTNPLPICILAAITSYIYCEAMQSADLKKKDDVITTYSVSFVLMFFLPGCFGFRFSRIYLVLITLVFELFGISQYYSRLFREAAVRPFDLKAFKSALEIKSSYSLQDQRGILSIIIGAVNVFSIYRFSFGKNIVPTHRLLKILAFLFFTSLFIFFEFYTSYITDDLNKRAHIEKVYINVSYRRFGCAFFFFLDYKMFSLSKPPPGYSAKKAKAILKEYTSEERIDKTKLRRPHIITILSESFTDYKYVKDFETNIDYMPFIRSLKENTIKGSVSVSAFGGNTCNSEYEYLTGNSMHFYTYNTPAYLGLVNNKQQSLVEYLTSLGYDTYGLTPVTRGLWNMGVVYNMLGFNHTYFKDEFYNKRFTFRGNPTDDTLFKGVIKKFEERTKGKPVFMFLTTMQNHGKYKSIDNPKVTVRNYHNPGFVNSYLTGLKMTNEALEKFLEHFKRVKEDVIVVFFGDHYPHIPAFLKALTGHSFGDAPFEMKPKIFRTPFFIWTNYPTEPEEGQYFALSYLSSKVMEVAGLPKTPYMKFLDEMKKHVPLLTPFCYADSKGTWHASDKKTDVTPYLEKYFQVQYYMINDRKK